MDSTVQEKAGAHPVDIRLLEIARHKVVTVARRCGLLFKQTFVKEGKELRRKAGAYAHVWGTGKCQRTILGMGCISKGEARKPYEFGAKVSLVCTHQHRLVRGPRSFPGNPYNGHTLAAQLEQMATLLQHIGVKPTTAIVDLGYRGVEADIAQVVTINRGRHRTLSKLQRGWPMRRQTIETAIGRTKSDHRMDRWWRQGHPATGSMRYCAWRATTSVGCCGPLRLAACRPFCCGCAGYGGR